MILYNGLAIVENELVNSTIECKENKIISVLDSNASKDYLVKKNKEEMLDCTDLYIFPGFIDCHVHGGGGGDSCKQTLESYSQIVKNAANHGTTSIVLAIGGMSDDFVHKSTELIGKINVMGIGATILGLHLEGPWVNPQKCGAIPKEDLDLACNIERAKNLICGYESFIKIITLAPELDHVEDIITFLNDKGIIVSLGHSAGSYEDANRAVQMGAKSFTHLFNASTPISGRDPGLVGSALCNKDCYCEIIADGQHVHPANVNLVIKIKKDHFIIMTDAIEVTGTSITKFELPGVGEIAVRDGRTWGPNNSIMGSVLTQDQALKNLITWGENNIVDLVNALTVNPAKLLGIYPHKGVIKGGSVADFTVMDKDLNIIYTIVGGNIVYKRV